MVYRFETQSWLIFFFYKSTSIGWSMKTKKKKNENIDEVRRKHASTSEFEQSSFTRGDKARRLRENSWCALRELPFRQTASGRGNARYPQSKLLLHYQAGRRDEELCTLPARCYAPLLTFSLGHFPRGKSLVAWQASIPLNFCSPIYFHPVDFI